MGRGKIEITEQVLKDAEKYASQGLTDEQISQCLGFSRNTLKRRKKDNEEFAAAIKRGKAKGIQQVSNALFDRALKGNIAAIIFYLKNRDSANWRDNPEPVDDQEAQPLEVTIEVKDARKHAEP